MEEKKREVLIKVDKLWQKRGKKSVLQDLYFTLHKEECLGIFGLRGSGKRGNQGDGSPGLACQPGEPSPWFRDYPLPVAFLTCPGRYITINLV